MPQCRQNEALTQELRSLDGRKVIIDFETKTARLLAENEDVPEGSVTATLKTDGWKVAIRK